MANIGSTTHYWVFFHRACPVPFIYQYLSVVMAITPRTEILLREDAHISMRIVPADRMMVQQWTGYVPSVTYRQIMNGSIDYAVKYEVHRWFADLREMGAILQPDERWTMEDWFPRLARTQVGRMAFLMSSDFFNRMSVDRIMNVGTAIMPLEVAYFGDIDEARDWLRRANTAMVE